MSVLAHPVTPIPAPEPPHEMLFEPVLAHWRRTALAALPAPRTSPAVLPDLPREVLTERVEAAFYTLHLRALVCHLTFLAESGRLRGDTPEGRYLGYCHDFAEQHSAEFDELFAVLARLRPEVARQHAAALDEFLTQLTTDRAGITDRFGIPAHARVSAVDGGGDSHDGGRRVAILTWDTGQRLVHKPRPVGGEAGYRALTDWLREHSPIDLPSVDVWDRGDHGWARHVTAPEPATPGGLLADTEFLRRSGELVALFHALGSKDMHRENLLPTARGPLVLDLETILHAPAAVGTPPRAPDDVWDALASSVATTGMLPTPLASPDESNPGWANVGFLASDTGSGDPFRSLSVIRPFRDDMLLTFQGDDAARPVEPLGKDESVAAARAVADGFATAYDWIADHRDAVRHAVTHAFGDARLRYLHADTQAYINVLRLSCSARAMADEELRGEYLGRIALVHPHPHAGIERAEATQLGWGHVPAFVMRAAGTTVCDLAGRPVAETDVSPLAGCHAKLAALGPQDRAEQLDLLWAAFVALHPDDHLPTAQSPATGRGAGSADAGVADLARDLADDLVRRARTDGDPDKAPSWLGPVPSADAVRPWGAGVLGFDLYTGRLGVAVALARASLALDHRPARDLATHILDVYAQSLDRDPQACVTELGTSAFTGAAGVVAALATAGDLLDRPDWAAVARSAVLPVDGEALDVIEGLAGQALATGDPRAARALLARLAAAGDDDLTLMQSGYAHGIAGLLHALAASALPDAEIGAATARLLGLLDTMRTPDGGDWYTSRFPDPHTATGWCHGSPGIALGLAGAAAARPGLVPGALVDTAVAAMRDVFGRNLTLCHGDTGNWAIASWVSRAVGHDLAADLADLGRRTLDARSVRRHLGDRSNRNCLNDTLLIGRAGVLHHLSARLLPGADAFPLTFPTVTKGQS